MAFHGVLKAFRGDSNGVGAYPRPASRRTRTIPTETVPNTVGLYREARERAPFMDIRRKAFLGGNSVGVRACFQKGGRPAMAVTTGFQGRTFDVGPLPRG